MNYFQRHLNWTWVLAYSLWFVLNLYADDSFGIAWWLSLAAAIFLLVVSGWVIKQKGRRLWWILLTPFFSPLWLKNVSLVSQSLPTITYEERQECLAYYEEEKKLQLILNRVGRLFDKNLGKYEDDYFEAQKALRDFGTGKALRDDFEPVPPMDIMDKIFEVSEYMHYAATDIVKRKKEMRLAPSAAQAMSSAWLAAYLDYEALGDPSNIAAGYNPMEVQAKKVRQKELAKKSNESLHKAQEEEREFLKHLNLSSGEYQRIVDYAEIAVAADEWLRKLEAECP